MLKYLLTIGCIFSVLLGTDGQSILITKKDTTFNITLSSDGRLELQIKNGTALQLKGELAIGLTKPLQRCPRADNCYTSGNDTLNIQSMVNGIRIEWSSDNASAVFKDCFELGSQQWFGGPERFHQHWPIQKLSLNNYANVLQELDFAAISEPYWLNSLGTFILVDEIVPLFIDQNTTTAVGKVCFTAKNSKPYPTRKKITLQYILVSKENPREAHLHAVQYFLGKPTGHPNPKLIKRPIWSTWARYKRDVNDDVLRKFLQEIVENGYPNGQFEIDDDWEDCYGSLTFRKSKFSKINETVSLIKSKNFTVSLWVHPFVNTDCMNYTSIGNSNQYFVKNTSGSALTQWWNSQREKAQYLDFTKPEVRKWFTDRLRALQTNHGIDSFKFDAGETSWTPQVPVLQGEVETMPNNIVTEYVKTCAAFGDLVEVRVGWRTQYLPIFVRMIDKDSTWGSNNGLYTLITTLLQMNMNGYTMVLPDMVGGNGYYGAPSAELFVRWLQANVFMPSIQFSYVPWDYKNDKSIDVLGLSMKFVNLHEKFADYIQKQMHHSIDHGHPVNAPIWWVDPTNSEALKEDTEFLLGEDILVAPVITEGATTRRVYLPKGTWVDGNTKQIYVGPKEILSYNATIDVLPYFIRNGSEVYINMNIAATGSIYFVGIVLILPLLIISMNNVF